MAPLRSWITLAAVSVVFFLITAATFTSLGVVLPSMIADLHWSWSAAGLGFTLLGVFCGITSYIPAWLIRRAGARATLLLGSVVMTAAFLCLARTQGVLLYYFAAGLAGLGFTLLATVPGTYLLSRLFERPAFAFGIYFTIGGLGGVAGPLVFLWIKALTGGWRDYWLASALAVSLAGLAAAALVDTATDLSHKSQPPKDDAVFRSRRDWLVKDALATPQFAVLAAAYATFLLCGITVNTIAVAHLVQLGVSGVVAGQMLSLEALVNAVARAGGGTLGDVIEPRKMLALSLLALIVGTLALVHAGSLPLMLLFAAGIGIGYGLAFLAATILLFNYFGQTANLELFSIVNLIATAASVGPLLAGWSHDASGSFAPSLYVLAGWTLVILVLVLMMRPPAVRQ